MEKVNMDMDVDKSLGKTCRQKCLGIVRQNLLVIFTLIGVLVGFLVGFFVGPEQPSANALMWIGMPGELYIRMLKLFIVPLVVCSVITGAARMDQNLKGRIGGVSLSYIMIDNFLGSLIGTLICLVVNPGEGVTVNDDVKMTQDVMETGDIFADLLRNIIPDNMVAACFQQAQTKYEFETKEVVTNNGTANVTSPERELLRKYVGAANATNVLGLIIVSTGFGITAATMGKQGEPFLAFFRSASEIIISIIRVLIWTTPVGVASLIAKTVASTGSVEDVFKTLGIYFLAVMVGLVAWGLIIIPLIFFAIRRTNPYRFLWTIAPSIMIVFATGSTMIALPESLNSLERKNGVDFRVSRFVAPLAATIGRSGSAIYISASCVFIIQTLGRDTHASDVILVILLTWISALAIPSVAGASLVTVLILLTALNIPGESAAMLFALEFFLDRSRSVANLIDQLTCCMVTDKFTSSLKAKGEHVSDTDDEESTDVSDENKKSNGPVSIDNKSRVHL